MDDKLKNESPGVDLVGCQRVPATDAGGNQGAIDVAGAESSEERTEFGLAWRADAVLRAVPLSLAHPTARLNTLRIGGCCAAYAQLVERRQLQPAITLAQRHGLAVQMVGQGSNVLFPDGELPALVLRLGGAFLVHEFRREADEVLLTVGAGALLPKVAKLAVGHGLGGLEALGGFPATVGGAVTMNAGCYGTEVADVLERATLQLADGEIVSATTCDLEPGYRESNVRRRAAMVLDATFRLTAGDAGELKARLAQLNERRWQSLPSGKPNAGSTFTNPTGDFAGRLLEQAGCKGLRHGGVELSRKHANVLVKVGDPARAADAVAVLAEARRRVLERFGVVLEPELVMLGEVATAWAQSSERASP